MPATSSSALAFVPVNSHGHMPGIVLSLLEQSYANLFKSFPEVWAQERKEWAELDSLAFSLTGNWIFLTQKAGELIGFASFDPREFPNAEVGHNCILPAFQGRGYGKEQLLELLRIIQDRAFTKVRVSTADHSFFISAQHMYLSCGFKEIRRGVIPPRPFLGCTEIEYELCLLAASQKC